MAEKINIEGELNAATTEGIKADSKQVRYGEEKNKTVEQKLKELNTASTSSQQDIDNLNANLGISDYPVFDEITAYTAGDVVNYNGKLYQFTSDHAAGAFDEGQVEETSLKKESDKANYSLKEEIDKNISKETTYSEHDFAISDENGKNIVAFDNGHIRTKHFDSNNIPYPVSSTKSIRDFSISDENGKVIFAVTNGHVQTKHFDSEEIINLIYSISGTTINNAIPLDNVNWIEGIYLMEDGNTDSTVVVGGQVSDYIEYHDGLAIIGGFVKIAQHYILASLYDSNKNKIGAIYASKDVNDDGVNTEHWQYLTATNDNMDSGYSIEDIKYIRVQSVKSYNPQIYQFTDFDKILNKNIFDDKKIAFFGGSFSSIEYGRCFKAYLRFKYNCFVRTFGVGGAGFGIKSCWYKGYPSSPELSDGKVVWEDSVPNQVDKAIQYCEDNGIENGFDYWILWASTNDFNTHIKNKGNIDYTVSDLSDISQFGNADTQDGGIILSIYKIRQAFPNAKILFFGSLPFFSEKYGYDLNDETKPIKSIMLENGNSESRQQQNTFKEFINDQQLICQKYHIPYLNQIELANVDEWNYTSLYNPEDSYLHPLRAAYIRWMNFQSNFIINN